MTATELATAAMVAICVALSAVFVRLARAAGEGDDFADFCQKIRDPKLRLSHRAAAAAATSATALYGTIAFQLPHGGFDVVFLTLLSFFALADLETGLVPTWAADAFYWVVAAMAVFLPESDLALSLLTAAATYFTILAIRACYPDNTGIGGGDLPIFVVSAFYIGPAIMAIFAAIALFGLVVMQRKQMRLLPILWVFSAMYLVARHGL